MRAVACAGLILLVLGSGGCSLLGKKKPGAAGGPRGPVDPFPETARGPGATPSPDRPVSTGGLSGLLAGQVVDASNRRPPATFIQVVSAQEAGAAKGAPVEVAADQNGYFVIQGLQAGQHYELIARAKDGDRMLAGRMWVRPPDPKVLIRISEDFATGSTPPVPPPPGVPGQRAPAAPGANSQSGLPREHDWAPGRGLTTDGRRPNTASPDADPVIPARSDTPGTTGGLPASPRPDVGSWPPNITSIPAQTGRITPPAPTPTDPPTAAPPTPAPDGPMPVPSCVLVGNRLHNLALRDVDGRTWEFRQRQGKLVLLDFWYTECIPCQHTIDHLKILQTNYGPGLEVVGVAYELGPVAKHATKVRSVAERKHINYRLLLGSGHDSPCPVRDQFQVFRYPTLFLLDQDGKILKKYEGLSKENLVDLETLLQYHLGGGSR